MRSWCWRTCRGRNCIGRLDEGELAYGEIAGGELGEGGLVGSEILNGGKLDEGELVYGEIDGGELGKGKLVGGAYYRRAIATSQNTLYGAKLDDHIREEILRRKPELLDPPSPSCRGEIIFPSRRRKNLNPLRCRSKLNSSYCRSTGDTQCVDAPRPAHAPATALRINRNSAPSPQKTTPRAVTLWRHACLTTPERVKKSPTALVFPSESRSAIAGESPIYAPLHRIRLRPGHLAPASANKDKRAWRQTCLR